MGNQRLSIGSLVDIDLGDGNHAFGRVIGGSEIAFYDLKLPSGSKVDLETIYSAPIAFIVSVMNYAVKKGRWKVIDKRDLEPEFLHPRTYFMKDILTGVYSIYNNIDGNIRPARENEWVNLERAAVWDPEHVEDRLRDHFLGKKNRWVEQLKG